MRVVGDSPAHCHLNSGVATRASVVRAVGFARALGHFGQLTRRPLAERSRVDCPHGLPSNLSCAVRGQRLRAVSLSHSRASWTAQRYSAAVKSCVASRSHLTVRTSQQLLLTIHSVNLCCMDSLRSIFVVRSRRLSRLLEYALASIFVARSRLLSRLLEYALASILVARSHRLSRSLHRSVVLDNLDPSGVAHPGVLSRTVGPSSGSLIPLT